MLRECLAQLVLVVSLIGGPCDPAVGTAADAAPPAALLVTFAPPPEPRSRFDLPSAGARAGTRDSGPAVLTDLAVVGGVTGLFVALNPNVRRGVFTRSSLGHILDNFRHPIRRSIEGARADRDGFTTNYVSHPLSWATLGLYLRRRGWSGASALLFSQAHSIAWEFVIEGSYQKPSGKDLITNLWSSAVAIYALYPLFRPAEEGSEEDTPRLALLLEPLAYPDLSPGLTSERRPAGPGLTVGLALTP